MGSWLGWLFIIFVLYLLVVLARGVFQFIYWMFEDSIEGYRERRRQARRTAPRRGAQRERESQSVARPARKPSPGSSPDSRHSSAIGKLPKLLKLALGRKSYDYWMTCALAEQDPQLKVEFLTKAVKQNPSYAPAWVLKANALYDSGRYREALDCYSQALELHSTPLIWYKRGLCCHRLHQPQEAIAALGKALTECRNEDRELAEDVRRMKKQLEAELQAS